MDREQTFDVVDTPPPDRHKWPSVEHFQEPEERLKWRDIQLGKYKVLESHNQEHSVVLKFESENGTTIFMWAPSSLVYAMEKRKCTNFILNHGAKRSEETGNIFYDFKVC